MNLPPASGVRSAPAPALGATTEEAMIGKWAGFVVMLAASTLTASVTAAEKTASADAIAPATAKKEAATVEMYVMPGCGYCEKARELLTKRGVKWTELDIASSADAKRDFEAKGGRGTPLLVVGGEVIQGLDAERIDAALHAHGIAAR
jgi:glutaredoxin 3